MKYSFFAKSRNILAIVAISASHVVMAQNKSIVGTLVDSETKESVAGAVIAIGDRKVYSDIDGRFSLPSEEGQNTITVTYIGYKPMTIDVSKIQNLGMVEMKMDTKVLPDAIITSQLAVPRKTPVSVSNVLASQIEERLGNDEFVEALKYAPGVHPNRVGGSWADSEIFVRGFDNSNVATLINGIPVNDMENGIVYWSNWASLT